MSISFSGNAAKTYTIPGSFSRNWYGQTQASQWFFLRIDQITGGPPGGAAAYFLNKVIFDYSHTFVSTAGSQVTTRFQVTGPGGNGVMDVPLTVGVVYGIAITWDGVAGQQLLWISGQPYILASSSGPTTANASPMTIGLSVANTNVNFTIGPLYILDGYVFTTAEKTSLLNGADPTTIGTSATWRGYYPLTGTAGATPVHTDAGLQNAIDGTLNFASEAGTGSAVYSAPLVWSPVVTAHPYVAGCGNMIGITFTRDSDGSIQIPAQLYSTPTIAVNGVDRGLLINGWGGTTTGVHQCELFSTPGTPPLQISPSDVVALTAPSAWCNTSVGPVAALAGTIANHSGGSSVGADTATRTLRVGTGIGLPGAVEYYPFKNAKYLMGQTGNFGKVPPGLGYQVVNQPCEAGLAMLVWDATKPLTPAICQLSSGNASRVTVTRLPQYDVSPPSGIGYVRVYQISYVVGSDYETVIGGSPIWFGYTDPAYTGSSNYDNLWIYLPGEFSLDGSGNPVFDRSDPFAISNIHLDRMPQNVGCLRGLGGMAGGPACDTYPYPELLAPRNIEWFWGFQLKQLPQVGFLSAGPVDVTATPWIYSPFFRQPANQFTATLTDTISTTPAVGMNETWHFSDGATAPLMAGLEIQVDSEVCRILSGSGTAWVVYRGSNGTTPATHSPGTVTVFGRAPITTKVQANGCAPYTAPCLIQCNAPHGMTTLQGYYPTGNLPMTMIDGATGGTFSEPNLGLSQPYVTGPTSFVSIWSGWYSTRPSGAKPSTTVALNTANNFMQNRYQVGIPLEVYCEHVGKFPSTNLWLNIPLDACDDMVRTYAITARDHFPAGRKIYLEWGNEPWNWAPPFKQNIYCVMMGPLAIPSSVNTSGNALPYYPYRSGQVHAIFRSIFAAAGRGGEIVATINCQPNSADSQITPHLNLGLALGTPFDNVATAPYFTNGMGAVGTASTVAAVNAYDNGQVAEQCLHDIYYDTSNGSMISSLRANTAAVAAYNAANGAHVINTVYEGGAGQLIPSGATNASPRQHDIWYDPNARQLMLGYYKLLQDSGVVEYNQSAFGYGWPDGYMLYHQRTQKHSRGDGQSGASNNRMLTITAGSPGYIGGSTLKQDRRADSPMGQAFFDWLNAIGMTPPPPLGAGGIVTLGFASDAGQLTTLGFAHAHIAILPPLVSGSSIVTFGFAGDGSTLATMGFGLTAAPAMGTSPIVTLGFASDGATITTLGFGSVTVITSYGNLREAVYARLAGSLSVAALVGSRIYFGALPQTYNVWTNPAISFSVISRPYGHTLTGADGTSQARVQISTHAASEAMADRINQAVRDCFDGFRGMMSGVMVTACLLENEIDITTPPFAATDQWIYSIASDYQINHRVSLPASLN